MLRICLTVLAGLVLCQSAAAGTTTFIAKRVFATDISRDGRFIILGGRNLTLLDRITGKRWGIGQGGNAVVSGDGRFVAFRAGSPNGVFRRDRDLKITVRVDLNAAGRPTSSDKRTLSPAISQDGRFVGFISDAAKLVPGDTNGFWDAFVRDMQTGVIERVSVDSNEQQGTGDTGDVGVPPYPTLAISRDGRFVAIATKAHLVPKEPTGGIFIRDRHLGTTVRVPVAFNKKPLFDQLDPSISDDGRFVTFTAKESRVGLQHIFVWDAELRVMERVDVSTNGVVADDDSYDSEVSPDGRFVVFVSGAKNLVPSGSGGVFIRDRRLHTTRRVTHNVLTHNVWGQPHVAAGGRFTVFIASVEGAFALFLYDQAN